MSGTNLIVSIAMNRTINCWIQASVSTNQGPEKRRFDPVLRAGGDEGEWCAAQDRAGRDRERRLRHNGGFMRTLFYFTTVGSVETTAHMLQHSSKYHSVW